YVDDLDAVRLLVLSGTRKDKVSFHVIYNVIFPNIAAVAAAVDIIVKDTVEFETKESAKNSQIPPEPTLELFQQSLLTIKTPFDILAKSAPVIPQGIASSSNWNASSDHDVDAASAPVEGKDKDVKFIIPDDIRERIVRTLHDKLGYNTAR
ncbi:hypothetical protein HDU96_005179, partial [Phlyctochytrium bullatum]